MIAIQCNNYYFDIRCIDNAGNIHKKEIHETIRIELLTVMQSSNQTHCVDYIQSLMEHYTTGEYVMMSLLPHG